MYRATHLYTFSIKTKQDHLYNPSLDQSFSFRKYLDVISSRLRELSREYIRWPYEKALRQRKTDMVVSMTVWISLANTLQIPRCTRHATPVNLSCSTDDKLSVNTPSQTSSNPHRNRQDPIGTYRILHAPGRDICLLPWFIQQH